MSEPVRHLSIRLVRFSENAILLVIGLATLYAAGLEILRLVETRGARGDVQVFWNVNAKRVTPVDLLERPLAREGLAHSAGAATLLRMNPFEIVTLRVE